MRDFHTPGRSQVLASNGMCATSHPLAAKVAVDILNQGGNAMDAAIAGAVLLGIAEPQMTGIGGDCFVLYQRPGESSPRALNGSGCAPAAASAAALRDRGLEAVPLNGPEAVTIPTAMAAFAHLSETEGKLGLDTLLAPAIHYADEGIPVAPRVAFDWPTAAKCLNPTAQKHYLVDGQIPAPGQIFRAPGQAEVLRRVSKDGLKAFYEGEVAEDMVTALRALGGVHELADFAAAAPIDSTPISGDYKGAELVEHPPNGQGATAILMLNILSHFDIASMEPFGTQRAHIEAEAAKLAYDARNRFLADPDYTNRLDHMLAPETAAKLAALIDPAKAMPVAAPLTEAVHKDTVYITVVDRDRMAVSLIYSIFHGFGSGIASDKFGILLQNRGAGFTLEQGHPNELAGGKRPMHTIIPAMMRRGDAMMPFGVMGGAYQPNGHARFVSNMVDFGMDPQSAIDAPRAFTDKGTMQVERGYSDTVRAELAEMGHTVQIPEGPIGGAQAILIREDGVLEGGSDPRKDGIALGY
ncbi:gamma-glutamyltransferase family protein [Lutimaribacter sp. EGI FJ00015]|uniref:Gamma-glutamyltransferase family protein n=1 Tax=Lutimaribacter degradans TaxID=2945989 RepID=A0ACC5ZWT7_9RHOB|nr:gamma-glutamyltransferase family protein [Lutimaribacter sp. EGI FJ00013]MCM2562792.1 gamma-glutamyltransferase family protein [Lutimaribacter sp. EGI FJ00013]MCO0613949.1 gamma-glutamyltransferase family protein [Lutimaribacter sp. EGI FJ00015]MCO0636921.1 gamma-glutamyltransferase family protein [Lutimaribacter sp. EGI FJ00014]